ncbi:2OG-Fe(II) oxygenase [Microbulbifer sp. CAU 1566]|uniref:2OG-Fe(II) oxygenase n=1 Tax=Microbulbifer sp. CAU 1566 TaxID=2933269 RepID=UPI002005D2F0|nr:2OG-Fe(II) oxygenase [Microbulbifer sp. CAU 1566]
MEFAKLQPDLQQWIRDAVTNGQQLSVMMDALLKAGYQPAISQAVEQCIADYGISPQRPVSPLTPSSDSRTSNSRTSASSPGESRTSGTNPQGDAGSRFRFFNPVKNGIDLGDRQVEILLALKHPNVVLIGNLLSDAECDGLIAMSRSQLTPSRVVNSERGTYDLGQARTSAGTYFKRAENPLIAGIESRISRLLGVPESRGEPLQILHYQAGAEYRPHYDFFNPERPGNKGVLSMGGQRVGTLIMYLNSVEAGGSTVFPRVGLDVLPKKGCGLFFSYANEQGDLDHQTLHGGSPVISGEKWIATKWLRVHDYVSSST